MTPMPVHLLGLATGVPPFVIDQQRALDLARRLFCGRSTQIERLLPVFTNSGILTRYSCVPLEWYEAPHGWADRNAVYLKYAVDLLEDAARRALAEAGLSVADIGSIVSVSTTGVATPSLDATDGYAAHPAPVADFRSGLCGRRSRTGAGGDDGGR
jgi:alkylresorcinol/alkylpyrone synthase